MVERDDDGDAVWPAVFDTAVGAGLVEAPRPADAGFAVLPGLETPAGFEEGFVFAGLVVAGVVAAFGADVAVPVFDGEGIAAVWGEFEGVEPAAVAGGAATPASTGADVGGCGAAGSADAGDAVDANGGAAASDSADDGDGRLGSPRLSAAAESTCDGWSLAGGPSLS